MPLAINTADPLFSKLTYLLAVDDDGQIKFLKGGLTPVVGTGVTIQPDGAGKYGRAFRTGQALSIESLVRWATQTHTTQQDVAVFIAHNRFNAAASTGAGTFPGMLFTGDPTASVAHLVCNGEVSVSSGKFLPGWATSIAPATVETYGTTVDVRSTGPATLGWRHKGVAAGTAAPVVAYVNGVRDSNFAAAYATSSSIYGGALTTAEFAGIGGMVKANVANSYASFDFVYVAVFIGQALTDADFQRLHDSLTGGNAFALTTTATLAAPAITAQPAGQSVTAGGTATFSATVTGTPAPTLKWQRSTNSGGSWADIAGAAAASYTTPATAVSGGSANNGDQYRLVATNSQGTATSNAATLTVLAGADTTPPALSGTIDITDVTQTSWVGTWAAATDAVGVTGYDISTDGGATWPTTNWPAATFNFTGYAAGTSYQVRVRARDAAGNLSSTISGSVTTLAGTLASINLGQATHVLKDNLGAVFANTPVKLSIQRADTDALVLAKNLSTSGAGLCGVVSDAALASGVIYDIKVTVVATGAKGLFTATAA
ncbi:hypothetical protein LNV23_18885 [Paucibacter sp. DJ1R-11]|uniref:hypothetical protein n=1 Tax=Paucibacter sp. DJ1R-11 TaxID=2893556 RepID=UPI0021E49F1E|nr:hypothetical protein [Paucibacter sp. DJ1R-11]MCV2365519.1 hypothetical protein [Paucibacter sp. DJ1R-11]